MTIKLKKIKLSNGETISYTHVENGLPPLVMLHGNICSGLHFNEFIPYISQKYDLFIPDMRGFGESSYMNPITCIQDLSEDMADFTDKLHLDRFDLLGWSAGGAVCMRFAIDYPNKVNNLLFIDSVSYKGCPMYDANGLAFIDCFSMRKEQTQVLPAQTAIEKQDIEFMSQLWDKAIYTHKKPASGEMIAYAKASLKQRNLPETY